MADYTYDSRHYLLMESRQWIMGSFAQPLPVTVMVLLLLLTVVTLNSTSDFSDIPWINAPKSPLQSESHIRKEFVTSAESLLKRARSLYPNMPFRITTNFGPTFVLPPHFAQEIRNMKQLHFLEAVKKDFHGHLGAFQGVAAGAGSPAFVEVIRKDLTKSLTRITEPLVEETISACSLNFGEPNEWTETNLREPVLDIVSRVSSRIFLGEELCRDHKWLHITKTYTTMVFVEASKLSVLPRIVRPIAYWLMPSMSHLRTLVTDARALMGSIIEARRKTKADAASKGEPIPSFNDAIEWAETHTAGETTYDPALFQLTLSMAAIHTTTDLTTRVLLDLASRPALVDDIRKEVVHILQTHGWKKTSLYNMKLLDSVIKESQRMKPINMISMLRLVMAPVTLSNGLSFRRGDRLILDSTAAMRDPDVYENPEVYDGYRFLRWRNEPTKEHLAHLVATSPQHFGFGHGEHACPGRFFAANEVKIVLCHLLLKYDWELPKGASTEPSAMGFSLGLQPATKIIYRRRPNIELDIDSI